VVGIGITDTEINGANVGIQFEKIQNILKLPLNNEVVPHLAAPMMKRLTLASAPMI